jgi:hypothetical protein
MTDSIVGLLTAGFPYGGNTRSRHLQPWQQILARRCSSTMNSLVAITPTSPPSEILYHPNIALRRRRRNSYVSVVRRNCPGGLKIFHLPEWRGIPSQVHVQHRIQTARRVAGDKKSLAVRRPVDGHEIIPVFYGDLARWLARQREQSNLMLGCAYLHCGYKSSIRGKTPVPPARRFFKLRRLAPFMGSNIEKE